MLSLDVAIAGGGIGGLATAVALSRRGHRVAVYEAASQLSEIGAGIQISPNASKHLIRWGVDEFLPELKQSMPGIKVRRWKDGSILKNWHTELYNEKFGGPYTRVHRADLQTSLLRVSQRYNVEMHVGSGVADYDFQGGTMTLDSGHKIKADLIVGADGIRSLARKKLNGPSDGSSQGTGIAIIRATFDRQEIEPGSDLAALLQSAAINLWIGPGGHAVAYVIKDESLVNLAFGFDDLSSHVWGASEHFDEIRTHFGNWDPMLNRLIGKAQETTKWPLHFIAPTSNWISSNGAFVLIGDATAVLPPTLAQGAAMAIEDAETLASTLSCVESTDVLPDALRLFVGQRMTRKLELQDISMQNLHLYHLDDGVKQGKRDDESCTEGELVPIWNHEKHQRWLYGHDVC